MNCFFSFHAQKRKIHSGENTKYKWEDFLHIFQNCKDSRKMNIIFRKRMHELFYIFLFMEHITPFHSNRFHFISFYQWLQFNEEQNIYINSMNVHETIYLYIIDVLLCDICDTVIPIPGRFDLIRLFILFFQRKGRQ